MNETSKSQSSQPSATPKSQSSQTSAREKMKESKADLIIANDIGEKYQKNPDYNEILLVNSGKTVSSGWKRKEKLAKLIKKELEKIL